MSYSATVKAQVEDRIAKIKGGECVGTLGKNMIVRYWEHVSPEHVESCVGYLREYTSTKNADTASFSVSGLVVDKTTLSGYWRGGKVTARREDEEKKSGMYTIFQELHEGYITTTKSGSSFIFTDWILVSGDMFRSNANQITIRLPNVAPTYVENIRLELVASDSFSSPSCKYEALSGTFYFTDCRFKLEEDGSYSIDLLLAKMGTASPAYVVTSTETSEEADEEVRLYEDIPAGYVTTLVNSLTDIGIYHVVNVDARKTSAAGIFDVYLSLKTAKVISGYLIVGKKESLLSSEEERLYRNIHSHDIASKVSEVVRLGSYTLVDCNLRRTSLPGVFDLSLRLRSMKEPPGGSEILIGVTGGLFKTEIKMRRNVSDASLTSTVSGLKQLALIDSVRATSSREEGYWDIIYAQLVIPAPRTEKKVSIERTQKWADDISYSYHTVWTEEQTGIGENNKTWISHNKRFPQTYSGFQAKRYREVTVTSIISYGTTASHPRASFSGNTGVGGSSIQLANGLWQNTTESVTFPWWGLPNA